MTILVCPLSQVGAVAAARQPARIISLLDPNTPFPDSAEHGVHAHLRLNVHDIAEDEVGFKAPCSALIGDIIGFVEGWDRTAPLLVHCYAGISRSTATAFVAACLHNPHAEEQEIAQALRAASPSATPNSRIVALADSALGRNGRMIAAVQTIGRGSPTWPQIPEAAPFELPSYFAGGGA